MPSEELEPSKHRIIGIIAIIWSLFQIWIASPFPFQLETDWFRFNDTETRSIHLAFAILLVYLTHPHPFSRCHPSKTQDCPISWIDIVTGLAASFCAAYLYLFYTELANRAGAPTTLDVVIAVLGVLFLLEATRRALGWALTIVASVFLFYTFAGPYMPDVLAHGGASLQRVAAHQWLTTEGVFGVALGVSTNFVFLFVLFGAMLQMAGAGQYFIRVAFSLLGHMKGGPAKAGVLASGLTGLMSGSSIANVVTTGTFTIPLMKRVGFPAYKAGAVEVAASTNGQLLPPVMGAAAFLMVEYTNTAYSEVIKHAFLPAIISYIALMYMVHLEAVKAGMQGMKKAYLPPVKARLIVWGLTISGTIIFFYIVYHVLEWIYQVFPDHAFTIISVGLIVSYIGLLAYTARYPEPDQALDADKLDTLPETTPTVLSGLHYLLPVVVLIWSLMVLRYSPGLSAFYAIVVMMLMLLTQRPLEALFRRKPLQGTWLRGVNEFFESLKVGAFNMVGIGVATATAGIVVGTVSLTGVGQVLTEVVEILSMGSLLLVLILTALLCMLLGMGLPTTANYIVVSTLMAPVIITLGQAHGLEVPLIAVHLFVFYFGIMADDTPPVGLAAFAAAGIAGSDPIRTGIQSFTYDIRTAILPFMFIFNTNLLLIGIESWLHLTWVIISSLAAMLLFVSVTQNYLLVRCRWWENLLLLLIAFSLFRPDYWRDQVFSPYHEMPIAELSQSIAQLSVGEDFRLFVREDDGTGLITEKFYRLTVPADIVPSERLAALGITIENRTDGSVWIADIGFMSPAENAGLDIANDNQVLAAQRVADQPHKEWFAIPFILLLAGLLWGQQRRKIAAATT